MLRKTLNNVTILWIFIFCLAQLSGCSFIGRKTLQDGPPSIDIDASQIPDAVPKVEPIRPSCNKDYTVLGKRYHVLPNSKGYKKRGLASWYGTSFHGRPTSTNENYNLYGMTAASKELPLPTYVQVKNLSNDKKIIVKVNDRGPFRSDRIIDLSYAAAKKLGFAGRGTTPVEVTAIDPLTWNKTRIAKKGSHKSGRYVQVAALSTLGNARKLSTELAKMTKNSVRITHNSLNNKHIYKIEVGPITNDSKYMQIIEALKTNGYPNVISKTS